MSRANIYNLGASIYFHFTIFDADGETPLSGEEHADFTFVLVRNTSQISVPPVTIAECGTSGTYYAIIIPTQIGTYQLRVIGNNDTVRVWHTFDFEVIAEKAGLDLVEKILKNKLTIAEVSGAYYQRLWDATGNTLLLQWRLYDKDNLDVILTGRGPASRGIPSGG